MNYLMEKLQNLSNSELIVIAAVVILLLLLLKFAFSIGKRVIIGLLYAAAAYIILTQLFEFSAETASIISIILFLIGFGIGRLFPSKK